MGMETKALENSAQRLSNLFSVGVPTVGYGGYSSFSELIFGDHNFLDPFRIGTHLLANTTTDLYNKLNALVDNATLRQALQMEVAKLASRHSPRNVTLMYDNMFRA